MAVILIIRTQFPHFKWQFRYICHLNHLCTINTMGIQLDDQHLVLINLGPMYIRVLPNTTKNNCTTHLSKIYEDTTWRESPSNLNAAVLAHIFSRSLSSWSLLVETQPHAHVYTVIVRMRDNRWSSHLRARACMRRSYDDWSMTTPYPALSPLAVEEHYLSWPYQPCKLARVPRSEWSMMLPDRLLCLCETASWGWEPGTDHRLSFAAPPKDVHDNIISFNKVYEITYIPTPLPDD